MTYAASEAGALAPCEIYGPPPRAVRRLVGAVWRAMEKSRHRKALRAMPDYLLKDIGINRCDIDYLVDALVDGRDDPTRSRPLWDR
jgi:uncharacterized protein YjiS (DUF1127 family)